MYVLFNFLFPCLLAVLLYISKTLLQHFSTFSQLSNNIILHGHSSVAAYLYIAAAFLKKKKKKKLQHCFTFPQHSSSIVLHFHSIAAALLCIATALQQHCYRFFLNCNSITHIPTAVQQHCMYSHNIAAALLYIYTTVLYIPMTLQQY